jgi:hypothetical protein
VVVALAAAALAAPLPAAIAAIAPAPTRPGASPLPLPLRPGSPLTLCLTDASAQQLARDHVELTPIAPSTLVTSGGRRCVKLLLDKGEINGNLSGFTTSVRGGLALRRGSRYATFTEPHGSVRVLAPTAEITAEHDDKRIDFLSTRSASIRLSPRGLTASDAPMALAPAAEHALARMFGASPWQAGETVFIGTAAFGVAPLDSRPASPR